MMSQSSFMTVMAPAKVNLFLHITGRTEAGYHELESLFVFVDVTDRLYIQPADRFGFALTGPFAPALEREGGENLVMTAARLLAHYDGDRRAARIVLDKRLPPAAGIGGGSADAAAALEGLSRLWGLALAPEQLDELALSLGADVPACLARHPQWVSGIGERRRRAPPPSLRALLLVNPGITVSTGAVFNQYAEAGTEFSKLLDSGPARADRVDTPWLMDATRNDLGPAAMTLAPEIGQVLDALQALPDARLVRMSGSGATCFAGFDQWAAADAAARTLAAENPGWWVRAGRILSG